MQTSRGHTGRGIICESKPASEDKTLEAGFIDILENSGIIY